MEHEQKSSLNRLSYWFYWRLQLGFILHVYNEIRVKIRPKTMFKIVHLYISIFVNVYLVDGNGKYVDNHLISNRQASYQMCMDTFDIYEDKIIRTQDSRELGAKYISERDVPSRQECYQLCCNTDKCDVFIFEEKVHTISIIILKISLFIITANSRYTFIFDHLKRLGIRSY